MEEKILAKGYSKSSTKTFGELITPIVVAAIPISIIFLVIFKNLFSIVPIWTAIIGAIFVLKAFRNPYTVSVTATEIVIDYEKEASITIPMWLITSTRLPDDDTLQILTKERTYTFKKMENILLVEEAIRKNISTPPASHVAAEPSAPTAENGETVIATGYPPALKPVLWVLAALLFIASIIFAIAIEEGGPILLGVLVAVVLLVVSNFTVDPYVTVTDKRVFCVTDFGRKLSLPLNKITAVSTHWIFKQLHIAAPCGRIHLYGLSNAEELYSVINTEQFKKQ